MVFTSLSPHRHYVQLADRAQCWISFTLPFLHSNEERRIAQIPYMGNSSLLDAGDKSQSDGWGLKRIPNARINTGCSRNEWSRRFHEHALGAVRVCGVVLTCAWSWELDPFLCLFAWLQDFCLGAEPLYSKRAGLLCNVWDQWSWCGMITLEAFETLCAFMIHFVLVPKFSWKSLAHAVTSPLWCHILPPRALGPHLANFLLSFWSQMVPSQGQGLQPFIQAIIYSLMHRMTPWSNWWKNFIHMTQSFTHITQSFIHIIQSFIYTIQSPFYLILRDFSATGDSSLVFAKVCPINSVFQHRPQPCPHSTALGLFLFPPQAYYSLQWGYLFTYLHHQDPSQEYLHYHSNCR